MYTLKYVDYGFSDLISCIFKFRKSGDMETQQHGNGSKIIFEEFPFLFRNSRKFLKSSELLRDFRIFCIRFPKF